MFTVQSGAEIISAGLKGTSCGLVRHTEDQCLEVGSQQKCCRDNQNAFVAKVSRLRLDLPDHSLLMPPVPEKTWWNQYGCGKAVGITANLAALSIKRNWDCTSSNS